MGGVSPEISGVGVRVAIYTQTFLSLAPSLLFMSDGKITRYESDSLYSINANLLLTACALLVSAFVQAATYGLSVYHAIIVLNLSWMNNASAVAYSIVDPLGPIHGEDQGGRRKEGVSCSYFRELFFRSPNKINWSLVLATIHLCAMASLGILVWHKIESFGNQPDCTPSTFLTFFWHNIPVAHNHLRIFSLILYTFTIIPAVNILLAYIIALTGGFCILLLFTLVYRSLILMRLAPSTLFDKYTFRQRLIIAALYAVAFTDILLVIDTELMIQRSKGNVKVGENQWTFGQTLAMITIALPLADLVNKLLNWRKKQEKEKMADNLDHVAHEVWEMRARKRMQEAMWSELSVDDVDLNSATVLRCIKQPEESPQNLGATEV
jgi:hypothetical protein